MQAFLPLKGATLCGYCLDPLTQQPEGDWACNACRPMLAFVSTAAEWRAFQRSAAKRKASR